MSVHFIARGRLGNAIFRYMAISIMCICCNMNYHQNETGRVNMSDEEFYKISNKLLKNEMISLSTHSYIMSEYYQHDEIYKKYKTNILQFIRANQHHTIITDGITAGDGKCETYKMIDIIQTPTHFKKIYKNVLHLRLEDFVTHNLHISTKRIIDLFEQNIITDAICIVCKQPSTEFEVNYIRELKEYFNKKEIELHMEHNDVITDYYIMKEANVLICSCSTLSWSAAFFSDKIQKCYLPNYLIQPGIMTCKYPIDNTSHY